MLENCNEGSTSVKNNTLSLLVGTSLYRQLYMGLMFNVDKKNLMNKDQSSRKVSVRQNQQSKNRGTRNRCS